jgi:hypothetical protein
VTDKPNDEVEQAVSISNPKMDNEAGNIIAATKTPSRSMARLETNHWEASSNKPNNPAEYAQESSNVRSIRQIVLQLTEILEFDQKIERFRQDKKGK